MTNIASLTGGHHDAITTLALSERNLASGSGDCTICLWSPMQSRSPVSKISLDAPCTSIQFAENKPDLIFASQGGNISSFDFRSVSTPIFNVKISDEEINSIDLLESEARIACGDDTGCIQIVSSDSGQLLRSLKKHDNICSSVLFRPNRTWQVISGGLDSRMVVSDWKESGRGVAIFEMSELLDFSDEEEEEAEEDEQEYGQEEEDQPDSSSTTDQSNWSEDSGNNPWQEAEDHSEQEVTPSVARRPIPDAEDASGELNDEQSADEDGTRESARVSRLTSISSHGGRHHVRIHVSRTEGNAYMGSAMSTGWSGGNRGMPLNPPMIHSLACSRSGNFVAAGLASNSVEIFIGSGKHLVHNESFYGHSRGVSALHMLQDDQFLVSGGNDSCLFVWPLSVDERAGAPHDLSGGTQVRHSRKIEAIAGSELTRVYVTDSRPFITMMDLSLC